MVLRVIGDATSPRAVTPSPLRASGQFHRRRSKAGLAYRAAQAATGPFTLTVARAPHWRFVRRHSRGLTMGRVMRSILFPTAVEPTLFEPTKRIAGRVLGVDNNPYLDGALVVLYRSDDDVAVASTISDKQGNYSFPRNSYDQRKFYVGAYTRTGPVHQTVSERTLVPK